MKEASDCLNELGATHNHLYLGDFVYGGYDDFGIWLITWNGLPGDPRNKIYLEKQVLFALGPLLAAFWSQQKGQPCFCCGQNNCRCEIILTEDSDPSTSYHAVVDWCRTHGRKAE